MPPAAIAVDNHCRSIIKNTRVFGVAVVCHHNRLEANLGSVQILRKQLAPSNMLVRKVTMALRAGHEYYLFVFGKRSESHA